MALDWCILGPDGRPDVVVPLGLEMHSRLMARAASKPLLGRAADYYADAEYAPTEVAALLAELSDLPDRGGLGTALPQLEELCAEAQRRGCGVAVLAD
jgi:hypothetical protein